MRSPGGGGWVEAIGYGSGVAAEARHVVLRGHRSARGVALPDDGKLSPATIILVTVRPENLFHYVCSKIVVNEGARGGRASPEGARLHDGEGRPSSTHGGSGGAGRLRWRWR